MFDKWLARFRDPVETSPESADETFYAEREDEIEAAREKAERLYRDCKEALSELEDALKRMENFEDEHSRKRFEDVIENIVEDRQQLLEDIELSSKPEELYQQLDRITERFQRMSRKESAVLSRIDREQKPAFNKLDRLKEEKERLNEFLHSDYRPLKRYKQLQTLSGRRPELKQKRSRIRDEMDSIDTKSPRKERKQVENRLNDLRNSDTWEEYHALQEEKSEAEQQRQQARQKIDTSMRKMDRGLKKLLYAAEHGDVTLPTDTAVLEMIRDRDREPLMDHDPEAVESAVKAALDAMPDNLISSRQQDKFRDGAETLMELSTFQNQIDELSDRIETLQQRIDQHDAPRMERELQRKHQSAKKKLQKRAERREHLRKKIKKTDQEIEETVDEIASLYEDAFHRDTVIRRE